MKCLSTAQAWASHRPEFEARLGCVFWSLTPVLQIKNLIPAMLNQGSDEPLEV